MKKAKGTTRRRLLFLLRLAATFLLVGLVLKAAPLRETGRAVQSLAPSWLALALATEFAWRIVSIWRWHLLLPAAGARLPFWETLRLGFIALFYNNFLPSTVGGDVAKTILAIQRSGAAPAAIVASVLVDRAVIGWGTLLLFGLGLIAFVDLPPFRMTLLIVLGGGLLAGPAVYLLARREQTQQSPGSGSWLRQLGRRALDKLSEISQALLRYRHYPEALAASALVSCLSILLIGLAIWCWCAALGHFVSPLRVIATAVILKIAGIVPVSLGNLGWTEGTTLLLLQWAGMPAAIGLAVGLLQRVANIGISLLGATCQFGRPLAAENTSLEASLQDRTLPVEPDHGEKAKALLPREEKG